MSNVTFSPQQQAIFDWIENGSGSAVVIAVAGSGKTTTLLEGVRRMSGRVVFCAYNKSIANEIADKLSRLGVQGAEAATFHALGFRAWRKVAPAVKIEGKDNRSAGYLKFDRIADELSIPYEFHAFVRKLVSFAKQNAFGVNTPVADTSAWMALVEHHDLVEEFANENGDYPEDVDVLIDEGVHYAQRALTHSTKIGREVIDFDDMIYLPLVGKCKVQQYDWILIDECQDTNPARRLFAKAMLAPGGRVVAVGDPAQAIYGFTGADSSSIENIKAEFGAVELPLTVSFRCPKAVVRVAQRYVSHIEAAPVAAEGEAVAMTEAEMLGAGLRRDDAILCRNNRPLVDLAFSLIRAGVPCHIEGRDIAANLVALVNRWKRVRTISALIDKLEDYRDRETTKALKRGREMRAQVIDDTVSTLIAIAERAPKDATLDDLRDKIESMFVDTATGAPAQTLTLSTIHKSKGREWHRVFWYGANAYQPSKFARQAWQIEQEKNLMYVAATRAKSSLVEVVAEVKASARKRAA